MYIFVDMINQKDINIVINAFSDNSNYNFHEYSEKSIHRRIEKILINTNISADKLATKIAIDKVFLERIKNDITVNTTELFRDKEIWTLINDNVIPSLSKLDEIRIWHAGCSSGEEVYSMMILLHAHGLLDKTKIIATDLNDRIIETAKIAEYKNNIIADYHKNFDAVFDEITSLIKKPKIEDYFDFDEKTSILKLKAFMRDRVEFINNDLVNDEPKIEGSFDIVFCRNVLIYFNMDLQSAIIKRFYDKLNKDGSIILGAHECVLNPMEKKFNKTSTIYKKKVQN